MEIIIFLFIPLYINYDNYLKFILFDIINASLNLYNLFSYLLSIIMYIYLHTL